ncbi:Phytochrome-like protein cph2 [Vibrio ruber DSM 16370]|uniref:Phytochrome-like protein cph2 n=1 Tax=Vibrio ruber (strain DSM 16370 / JCM 11486 / BCRC 17186 / CECT 7878 / LMG 23124 / VR1) TaxID=1123498 RepID=A0A1R4L891_VIBR1|nr:EAL domain-containing protein [Vibrio ruber]SJN52810.1 Phytochrome-like protein cph2 [Vibrio ruber DSM 16370]
MSSANSPLGNERHLLWIIQLAPIFVVGCLALVLNSYLYEADRQRLAENSSALYHEMMLSEKLLTQQHVALIHKEFGRQKSYLMQHLQFQVRQRVYDAYELIRHLYDQDNALSPEEIKLAVTQALQSQSELPRSGYFFIQSRLQSGILKKQSENIQVLPASFHPDVPVSEDFLRQIERQGESFFRWDVQSQFPSSMSEPSQREKMGFGKYFSPLGWVIGAVENVTDMEHNVQQSLLKWIDQYPYEHVRHQSGGAYMISVVDQYGRVLADNASVYIGKQLKHILLPEGKSDTWQSLAQSHLPSRFVQGKMVFNNGEAGDESMLYIESLGDWGWHVVAGFPMERFDHYFQQKFAQIKKKSDQALWNIVIFSVLFSGIVLLLSFYIGRLIAGRFSRYQEKIRQHIEHVEDSRDQMHFMAMHDVLTSLPNRMMFLKGVQKEVFRLRAKSQAQYLVIVFVDLDEFKKINDTYGHATGDQLLMTVAERFRHLLGAHEFVSRFGGDEFVFCFSELLQKAEAEHKVSRIQRVFDEPFELGGTQLQTTCSIGASLYPDDGTSAEELLHKADVVLYQAKKKQRGSVVFYNQEIHAHLQHFIAIEAQLQHALRKHEMFICYQPLVHVKTWNVLGLEALVRWDNDVLGAVAPEEFIHIAEDVGLIYTLGNYIFERACREVLALSPNGLYALSLNVNVSAKQLLTPGFVNDITAIIEHVGIDISRIHIEITESAFIREFQQAREVLFSLRRAGLRISLDDFGKGYASLSYLNQLPIDEVKIDKSFIDKMLCSEESCSLIKTILAIGQSAPFRVVAEGVETYAQLLALTNHTATGCLVQGYYFDKPMSVEMIQQRMRSSKRWDCGISSD